MKKICVFLILLCYESIALSSVNKHLESDSSLLKKNVSLKSDKKNIRQSLEYLNVFHAISFVYVEEKIPWEERVDVSFENEHLHIVLESIFKNTGITFFSLEDQIALCTKDLVDSLDTDSSFVIKTVPPNTTDKAQYKKVGFRVLNENQKHPQKFYYIKYKRSLFPKVGFQAQDSLLKDTLPQVKDSLIKTENLSPPSGKKKKWIIGKNSLVLQFALANTAWKSGRKTFDREEELRVNKYHRSPGWKFGMGYQRKLISRILWNAGFGVDKFTKKGIHTIYKINNLYPTLEIIEYQPYDYNFFYVSLSTGLKFLKEWNKWYLTTGFEVSGNFSGKTDMKYYPIYQIQYFTRVLPLDGENEKFTDKNNAPIVAQQVNLKKILPGFIFEIEAGWKVNASISVLIATGFSYQSSIYKKPVIIEESPRKIFISAGLRYNLK